MSNCKNISQSALEISKPKVVFALLLCGVLVSECYSQSLQVPRRHDQPPGPAISAEEAIKKMTVPEGFHVEIVAAEPDIINPVSMAIDEKGRFWVTESIEYPRMDAGLGKDRIKVLEDTDGDGRIDKSTIFAEGLNIPSAIAIGHNGVWVVNSPDLLFLEDTDGDLHADRTSVLLTGFGRTDTHELPSALTWGPDGWLYGLNGVFNYCNVAYGPDNPNATTDQSETSFTCAIWRINPWSKKFEVFAEGTSNPWGIAINNVGEFFLSACVIDHLWHFSENGYYIRQGGPYPPNTWPMRSIVDHHHQKAAYCGITYYDSDAYPSEFRNVLYMGNIHGGCLNSDVVKTKGSTYFGTPKDDLLTANDAWFMPVAQATGPDGCLYVLDWYDQYHCYQDANADPAGVERLKGRLYRLAYHGEDPSAKRSRIDANDLATLADRDLVNLLASENGFERTTAQRLLAERSSPTTIDMLKKQVADNGLAMRTRILAVCVLGSMIPSERSRAAIMELSTSTPAAISSKCIRFLGNFANDGDVVAGKFVMSQFEDEHFDVANEALCLDLISALAKCQSISLEGAFDAITKVALLHPSDSVIQGIAYNCLRNIGESGSTIDILIANYDQAVDLGPWATQWATGLLAWAASSDQIETAKVAGLASVLLRKSNHPALQQSILSWIHSANLKPGNQRHQQISKDVQAQCAAQVAMLRRSNSNRSESLATLVMASWNDVESINSVATLAVAEGSDIQTRSAALRTLATTANPLLPEIVTKLLFASKVDANGQALIIDALGDRENNEIASLLCNNYDRLPASLKPKAIELLTQRPSSSKLLLLEISNARIPAEQLNLNQLRRLASFKDEALQSQFVKLFGTVKENDAGARQSIVRNMKDLLAGMRGDPFEGRTVFKKVCAQCHVLHGEGAEVGPDITRNGRNDWNQLIQNVFDPSQVIGPGYQAVSILTDEDRIVTGLPVEETDLAVTLKIQGGKLEVISRDQIEELKRSPNSLMPEQIETQMTPQETADLFAYLSLDLPPENSQATQLPGSPVQAIRSQSKP